VLPTRWVEYNDTTPFSTPLRSSPNRPVSLSDGIAFMPHASEHITQLIDERTQHSTERTHTAFSMATWNRARQHMPVHFEIHAPPRDQKMSQSGVRSQIAAQSSSRFGVSSFRIVEPNSHAVG
jgi:hypothetical protein